MPKSKTDNIEYVSFSFSSKELEEFEWLRKYCFDNRLCRSKVIKDGLRLYRKSIENKENK